MALAIRKRQKTQAVLTRRVGDRQKNILVTDLEGGTGWSDIQDSSATAG